MDLMQYVNHECTVFHLYSLTFRQNNYIIIYIINISYSEIWPRHVFPLAVCSCWIVVWMSCHHIWISFDSVNIVILNAFCGKDSFVDTAEKCALCTSLLFITVTCFLALSLTWNLKISEIISISGKQMNGNCHLWKVVFACSSLTVWTSRFTNVLLYWWSNTWFFCTAVPQKCIGQNIPIKTPVI